MDLKLEQARAAANARIATHRAEESRRLALLEVRAEGRLLALRVTANMPLVRVGGNALKDLREDCFDQARAANGPVLGDTCSTYATALMGGEPFARWN